MVLQKFGLLISTYLISQTQAAVSCDPNLKSLSVASDNLINSIEEWVGFTTRHNFFLLGVSDSSCLAECCQSEPLLNTFNNLSSNRVLTYPDPQSSRKDIKIARIDLLNHQLFADMGTDPTLFEDKASIFIVKDKIL